MKKLMDKLTEIQKDKLLHFFYGTIISFIGMGIFGLSGLLFTLVAAAWKELFYDWYLGYGNPDIWDFNWTMAPALMFIMLYAIQ